MAVRLESMCVMLLAADVPACVKFYTELLGFQVTGSAPNLGRSGWASLEQGGVRLMLASPAYIPDSPLTDGRQTQAMYYFYPEDLQKLHRQLRAKGGQPSAITERAYGMSEFELVDPAGHVLVFGQATPDEGETDRQ